MKLVKILERGGMPEYAVISYADYEAMRDAAEMLDDIAAYDKAKAEMENCEDEAIPFDMAMRLSDGANPCYPRAFSLAQAQFTLSNVRKHGYERIRKNPLQTKARPVCVPACA